MSETILIGGVEVRDGSTVSGKTKEVFSVQSDPNRVVLVHKNKITAGNGAREADVEGKGRVSNQTSALFMDHLRAKVPVAHERILTETASLSLALKMYLLEVVVSFAAYGSLCKSSGLAKGTLLPAPLVRFFLKTTGRVWEMNGEKWALPCDDPMMEFKGDLVLLHNPGKPGEKPFLELYIADVFEDPKQALAHIAEMREMNLIAGGAIRKLGEEAHLDIPDYKLEWGVYKPTGQLHLGDVCDLESGRAIYIGSQYPTLTGQHVCKQYFREGGDSTETVRRYYIGLGLLQDAVM